MKVSNETEDRTNQQSTATATTNVTRLHRDRERYRQIIKQILFDLNFRSKLVGTQYLEEAIVVRCSFAQKTIRAMDIYKYVALHHSANPVNVERAIRNTLYDCYRHGELAKINKLFGTRIVNNAYPPTSSDFICEVASRIRYGFKYTDPPNETALSNNTQDYSELIASTHALGGDSWQDRFTSIFGKNK